MHAAERVIGDVAGDVRSIDHGLHHRANLRLGSGIWPRAVLIAFGDPFHGIVAIEIEAVQRRRRLDRDAIVILNHAFGQQPIELAAARRVVGFARNEQARIAGIGLPRAIGIAHAHHEDAAIAVDVFFDQAVLLIGARVGAHARSDELGPIGQRPVPRRRDSDGG